MLCLRFRSSHGRCSVRKGVLRNYAKFTGKHLCQSLFSNKVAGLRLATLLKKRLWHRCFPVNFLKFLRTTFFIEHLCWLLLNKELTESILSVYDEGIVKAKEFMDPHIRLNERSKEKQFHSPIKRIDISRFKNASKVCTINFQQKQTAV